MLFSPPVETADRSAGTDTVARSDRWWAGVAYACVAAVTAGGLIAQTGTFFRGPDWSGLAAFHDGPSWAPFDGSLSLTSGLVFGAVAPLAEWTFWPYRVVAVAALGLALVAIFRMTRHIAGPEVGALATALLASFTHATPLLTQPFTMRIPLSVAIIVALVGYLDARGESHSAVAAGPDRRDVAALALFAAALATSVVGVAAMPIVAATLIAQRATVSRWAPFAVPPALWLAWFVWHGSLATEPWTWTSRGYYLANLVGRSFQHLACNSATLGPVVAAGFVAVLWTDPTRRLSVSWRPVRWLAAAAVVAVVTTYRNGSIWIRPLGADPPDYDSWVVAVFIVVASVESIRHRHRLLPEAWRQAGLGIVGVAIALSAVTLAHSMETYREAAPVDHGLAVDTIAAIDSVARLPDDSWTITVDYGTLSARQYQDVSDHLGSPLDHFGIVPDESAASMATRDGIVAEGLGIEVSQSDCQWASAPASETEVRGPGRVVVAPLDPNEPVRVFLTRLAPPSADVMPFAEIEPGQSAILTFPGFDDGRPWTVRLDGYGVLGTCVD